MKAQEQVRIRHPRKAKRLVETLKKEKARPLTHHTSSDPFDGLHREDARSCGTLEKEWCDEMSSRRKLRGKRAQFSTRGDRFLDTTTFSRVVKDFVIQGGNLSTGEKWGVELSKRASRKLPDEPSLVKHVRGIVSMARGEEPNSATTHFFILVGEGQHLNGKFAAFGKVRKGMEVADAINAAPKDGDKPEKPVRINRAVVAACPAAPAP